MSVKVRQYRGKPGVWEVDVALQLPDGTPYRKRVKVPNATRAGAERWGNDHLKYVLQHGSAPAITTKEAPTLEAFKPTYLDFLRGERRKPSYINSVDNILKYRLLPKFGSKRVGAFEDEDIISLKADMEEEELSAKTVNNSLVVLNQVFKLAVKLKHLVAIPVKIDLLKYEPPEMEFYEHEQLTQLVTAAGEYDPRALALVLLGADGSCRAGEMLGLERTDIDHRRRLLHIQRSVWRGEVTLPKGGKKRIVPMTARLSAALKAIEHLIGPRVFYRDPEKSGVAPELASQQTLRTWMGAAQKKARLREDGEAGLHILRHTFCSHLAMRGATAMAIKELAGHRSLSTTMRYMHLAPSEKNRAIALLEKPWPSGEMLEKEAAGEKTGG